MTSTQTKQDVLNAVDADEARWNRLVEAVGPELMEAPGPMGDWTFKDLAAHINGWRESALNRVERELAGGTKGEPWPSSVDSNNLDQVNDWLHGQNRDRPVSDVLADTHALYDRLRGIVASVPEDRLFDASLTSDTDSYGAIIADGRFFEHLGDEHELDVTAWLKSQGKEPPKSA